MASLEFEITDKHNRLFLVQFESDSLKRNLIMNVSFDELPIDVPELRMSNPVFYATIKNRMMQIAADHYQSLKQPA